MKDSFSINKNTRRYEDEKTQMDEGGCLRTQCRFDHGLVCRTGFCRMDRYRKCKSLHPKRTGADRLAADRWKMVLPE